MPQLDMYILSSHIYFLFAFFLFYFLFLKKMLPLISLDSKIKMSMLTSFKYKFIVDYFVLGGVLNSKYKHFIIFVNLFDYLSDYIYTFSFYRGMVPYSFMRYYLLLSIRLEEFD